MGPSAEQLLPALKTNKPSHLLRYPTILFGAVEYDKDQVFARDQVMRTPTEKPTLRMLGIFSTEDNSGKGMSSLEKLVPSIAISSDNFPRSGRGLVYVVHGNHSNVYDVDYHATAQSVFKIGYMNPLSKLSNTDAHILAYGHCVELPFENVSACPMPHVRELFNPQLARKIDLDRDIHPMSKQDISYMHNQYSGWSHGGLEVDDVEVDEDEVFADE